MEPSERILVVEDDEDLCAVLCRFLSSEGFRAESDLYTVTRLWDYAAAGKGMRASRSRPPRLPCVHFARLQ